ncbi:cap-specific mRNA (nucleoside-2'-O-)-methyltransferase 1-like [Sabethes cyaneus]|uniref:cap-specific mRNA (nucleoside-2'-O-)-methyltransferase 1-like n=1 Tax=Sabethes cyaneus TaxID=53552 RepID=UPI00237E2279|nr:cap-specific mRNA (nucleoside-2'-O-)-methyltransferase 1-like [Sabethes cyaneus]
MRKVIQSNIFMNQTAVKMANLDCMFDNMFTKPMDKAGNSMLNHNEVLYFADICAGPGGFSDRVLWRSKWHAKVFGFTLKGENDSQFKDFLAGTPEAFNGPQNNGDMFDLENIDELAKYVLEQTGGEGVHVMMADGGFSVEGNENMQEVLSKPLYLYQLLVALKIVRTGGHCVVKLFDLFTPFSVGLLYLISKCFDKISICKPNSSRPANSERYLVCKWKKHDTELICKHLYTINDFLQRNSSQNYDILELVPLKVLKEDSTFYRYICNSNNELGTAQISGLLQIAAFAANQKLVEANQEKLRFTDGRRQSGVQPLEQQTVEDLLRQWSNEKQFLAAPEKEFNMVELEKIFPSIHGVYFVPIQNDENSDWNVRSFFIGRGGRDIWQYNVSDGDWYPLKDVPLELPPRTLIYGEIVMELQGEGKSPIFEQAFHIIDAIVLGGEDIRKRSLPERSTMCKKFAEALSKPHKTMPVRCKKLVALADLDNFFMQSLQNHTLDGALLGFKLNGQAKSLPYDYILVLRAEREKESLAKRVGAESFSTKRQRKGSG